MGNDDQHKENQMLSDILRQSMPVHMYMDMAANQQVDQADAYTTGHTPEMGSVVVCSHQHGKTTFLVDLCFQCPLRYERAQRSLSQDGYRSSHSHQSYIPSLQESKYGMAIEWHCGDRQTIQLRRHHW